MSPVTADQHVASYDILVEGQDLAQEQKNRIKEIRVADYLRLPDVCTIHLSYPKAVGVDAMPFKIGTSLEVRLGARQSASPTSLFKGQVVTIEPEFGGGGCSVLIRAYDRSHLLHRSRRVRTFQNQTASDVVTKIVQENGLSAECDASGEPYEFLQQDNETDWDFIWRLAERVGFEFVVDDQTAHFRKPTQDGAVDLEWPTTLRTFRPRVTAVQQVHSVTLLAQDPIAKQAISSTASSPEQIAQIGLTRGEVAGAFPDAEVHVATEPVHSAAEGDALAQALLDKLANGYIAAEGVAPGNPKLKAGVQVNVTGVGSSFGGKYRIATSTHLLRGGGAYETHFANSASHTILGTVGGGSGDGPSFGGQLVVGVVTNTQDPEEIGRVRVSYPALGDDVEGAWARVVTLSAGNARGALMLPVVGEEVLVGFEHEDTTRPYVLGSLFSTADRPGDDLLQGQDGSFSVKSDEKVRLESAKDTIMKSGGALTIDVSSDTALTGQGAVDIKGQDVTVNGKGQVTVEGMTSLTLKCGGSQISIGPSGVTISGPMISLG
jgi:phage protein D